MHRHLSPQSCVALAQLLSQAGDPSAEAPLPATWPDSRALALALHPEGYGLLRAVALPARSFVSCSRERMCAHGCINTAATRNLLCTKHRPLPTCSGSSMRPRPTPSHASPRRCIHDTLHIEWWKPGAVPAQCCPPRLGALPCPPPPCLGALSPPGPTSQQRTAPSSPSASWWLLRQRQALPSLYRATSTTPTTSGAQAAAMRPPLRHHRPPAVAARARARRHTAGPQLQGPARLQSSRSRRCTRAQTT